MAAVPPPAGAGAAAAGAGAAAAAPPAVIAAPAIPTWQANANALGLNPPQMELYELLVNFHNFTHEQYVCLMNTGGYSTLMDFVGWGHKAIRKWCENITSLSHTRGGRTFGDNKIKQLQGVAWYVNDCQLRATVKDIDGDYKPNSVIYKQNAEMDHLGQQHETVTVNKPAPFSYENWIKWEDSIYTYFDSERNASGVPLSYVIRRALPAGTVLGALSRDEQLIHNAPLHGFLYDSDNKTVGSIIRELCLGTPAEVWIGNEKRGRECMIKLQNHYDGPDEARTRIQAAKAKLDRLFYKAEAGFSFEKYVTTLAEVFNVHERYKEPMFESDKLKFLFDKCQNNHPEFKQCAVLARSQHSDFIDAVQYLKTEVARLFPDGGRRGSNRREISAVNGGKGGKGSKKREYNGVDTSDLTRWFPPHEFKKLPPWLKKKISMNKYHQQKNKEKIDKVKKAKVSQVNTDTSDSNVNLDMQQQRLVAAIITGQMNASRSSASTSGNSGGQPLSGRAATKAAAQVRTPPPPSDVSVITYNHLGNQI